MYCASIMVKLKESTKKCREEILESLEKGSGHEMVSKFMNACKAMFGEYL